MCQGSIELLLTLEHDQSVREILRILFAQQYEESGDWPQWFMLEPYSVVQDKESHGDIIVWPLKALCDYLEYTNNPTILSERIGELTEHFKTHQKDHGSRRGLLMLVSKRRRLLDYLKQYDSERYKDVIQKLGIRK